jgi:hypothetical protein
MKRRSIVVPALALVLWVAFGGGARAEKYYIDGEVWAHFQSYLKTIGAIRPGAYAITRDGHGAFYVYCQETRCMAGPSYSQDAVDRCKREYGTECVVFAVRDVIKVEYEIVDDGSGKTSGNLDVTPPSSMPITVAPDVQAKIKAYLNNAGSTGRSWALAIAKNGSKVESAACAASSSFVGGPCEPTKGSPQELASREALARCGGPSDCILLYQGDKMATGIQIVDGNGAVVFDPEVATVATATPATAAPATPAIVATEIKKVETPQPPSGSNPAPSAPAVVASAEPAQPARIVPPKPALKIAVSPALQSDIDSYLRNAQSTARLWAFAIAKDGSDGAMASCPAGGGWSGGGTCEPVKRRTARARQPRSNQAVWRTRRLCPALYW